MQTRKSDQALDEEQIGELVRSSRFVEEGKCWYFVTREGIRVGPYTQLFDAELGASLLVARLAQLDSERDPRQEIIQFQNDPTIGPTSTIVHRRPEKRLRAAAATRHSPRYIERISGLLGQLVPVVHQARKSKS